MAAASASSWENREADWESYLREQAGLDPCNESSDEEDACRHRAPTKNEAGDRLFSYLLDQLESGGRVSAKMICIIGYWAALSGAEGKVGNLSVHPQSSSGNFQKHLDVLMKHNEAKDIIYNLDVPGYCRSELGNSTISLPVAPAHERLLQDIVDDPHLPAKLRSMKTNGELPLTYDNHPVKLRHENKPEPIYPLSLYIDGVQATNKSNVLVVTVQNLCTGRRHLLALLQKAKMCKCGCRSWCTLWQLMQWLHWCFSCLAEGVFPNFRHNGDDWKRGDDLRRSMAGKNLHFRACLCQIRCDWAEISGTLGFSSWASMKPCFLCDCGLHTMLERLRECSAMSTPWPLRDMATYEATCSACEIIVQLTQPQWRRVLTALYNDRRKDGSRGLALMYDLPDLGLLENDRLTPSKTLPNPAELGSVTQWPVTVTFWRKSMETWVRYRNPLMDVDMGITLVIFVADILHTMSLGVYKSFVMSALWHCIIDNIFEVPDFYSNEEKDVRSMQRLDYELTAYYRKFRSSNSSVSLSEVYEISPKLLGKRGEPFLHTKAAETDGLLGFAEHMIGKYRAALSNGVYWMGSAEALHNTLKTLRTQRCRPPMSELQAPLVNQQILCLLSKFPNKWCFCVKADFF